MDWEEEVGAATDPASVGCQTAAGNNKVSMRMMCQGLTPAVQNGDHSGLSAQMLWISTDDADCLCCCLKQDVVDHCLVLEGDGGYGRWYREHDVEITDGEQIGFAIGKPLSARQTLALWAVSVTATAVGDADQATIVALLDVAAKSCGAAQLNGSHDSALFGGKPSSLRGAECIAVAAKDIRHLQCGAHPTGF